MPLVMAAPQENGGPGLIHYTAVAASGLAPRPPRVRAFGRPSGAFSAGWRRGARPSMPRKSRQVTPRVHGPATPCPAAPMPEEHPMTAVCSAPETVAPSTAADGPSLAARLDQLEAFANQASSAIEQLVSAVVDVQQAKAADAATAELEAMKLKLREVEQQLALERSTRDLAQVSRMHPKARVAVFVGTTYFGCNVKYAWRAAHEQAAALGLEVWFLPYNAEQERLVTDQGGSCLPAGHANWTPAHLHTALSAAVVVTSDHFLNPNPYAAALLAGARHVQLWHGVSIKEIGLRNLAPGRALGPHFAKVLATCGPYATLLGTAALGEDEWRRWFSFERYAPLGYPRNDVLYRQPTEADLAGCDRDTYARAQATLARGKRVLLYAPTFRDGRPDWVLHAGLDKLAQAAAQGGDLLVVNLHPVESPQIPKLAPQLPGVAFVQPRTDLYPLLGQASALITDYSSVMFDYLHVDRPVLLFRPDHEAYTQKSRRLFDDKLKPLPGPLFDDAAALGKALRRADMGQTDDHRRARQQLRVDWFDHHDGQAAQRLLATLDDELTRAGAGRPGRPQRPSARTDD
jgi:CDP-glycerol glycerophosphotransferase